jgi:hypothetical protein
MSRMARLCSPRTPTEPGMCELLHISDSLISGMLSQFPQWGRTESLDMRREIINEYRRLNSRDQTEFHRWLWANTIVGAILLAGVIVLVSKFSGGESVATAQTAATSTQAKLSPTPRTDKQSPAAPDTAGP